MFVYIGHRMKGPASWEKRPQSELGLSCASYDPALGSLTVFDRILPDFSVGALHYDPERELIYAMDEVMTLPRHPSGGGGRIATLARNADNGRLRVLDIRPSFGSLPAGAARDLAGKYLLVVHHTGHSPITRTRQDSHGEYHIEILHDEAGTVLFALDDTGMPQGVRDIFRHVGTGARPAQSHPQLHAVTRAPKADLFVVCDKGADQVHIFGIDHTAGKLLHRQSLAMPPGSAPRYAVFHPTLPVFYVNCENEALLISFGFDTNGKVVELARTPVTPSHSGDDVMQSDLILSRDGATLISLLRGAEDIAFFTIHPSTGLPELSRTQPTGLKNLRAACFTPEEDAIWITAAQSGQVALWPQDANAQVQFFDIAQPGPILALARSRV